MPIPSPTNQVTVDAIVCYHNHEESINDCIQSLRHQVRQVIWVIDGDDDTPIPMLQGGSTNIIPLVREKRHGVANSFNYGAFHSNADYFLYVDPHCTFKPKAVANLVKALGDEYDFCWGTGTLSFLTEEPWKTLLAKSDQKQGVRLTFLVKNTLWERMKGIPEPPHCHMDVLADELIRSGTMVALVNDVCHHQTQGGLWEVAQYYYSAARSYARTAKAGYTAGTREAIVQQSRGLTATQIAQLLSGFFSCAHALGAVEGLGALPTEPLDMVAVGVDWGSGAATGGGADE